MKKCNCRSGQSCSVCCSTSNALFALKFSGVVPSNSDTQTLYLADRGVTGTAGNLVMPVNYPAGLTRRFSRLVVNLVNAIAAGGPTLTVQLLKNNVPVPNALLSFGGSNPLSGVQLLKLNPEPFFAAKDLYDLAVTTTGTLESGLGLSAELIGRFKI